jgi:outer membrane protein assembly factor BamD
MLAVLVAALFSSSTSVAADREVTAQERFELGQRYMKRGNYTKALEQFNRVRNYHRDDPASVRAELAIADIHFKKSEFEQARLAYEDFVRLHPRHEQLDYAIWRQGQCLYKRAPKVPGRDQTATRQAVSVWGNFADRFPESEHRAEVQALLSKSRERLARKELAIAQFYAKRNAWLAVRRRSEALIKRYPEASVVDQALALTAEAYHRWGLTEEARAAREQLAQRFPDSGSLHQADRVLAQPPGSPPEESVFIRPYRLPSAAGAPAGGPGQPR